MTTFDALYDGAATPDVSVELRALVAQLHIAVSSVPSDLVVVRASLIRLLEFLASKHGRTDANCRAVDSFLTLDETWTDLPAAFHEILADMSGALHDTVCAPEISYNSIPPPSSLSLGHDYFQSNHDA